MTWLEYTVRDDARKEGCCQLCGKPVSAFSTIDWHPECWVDYKTFITDDLIPLMRDLAEKEPLVTLYAFSKEFRDDINAITIRE